MGLKAKELLEIFIITYNRSVHLDNTLRQLVGCPFTQFPITILDNCSEDNTHAIFLNYQHKFPNLNYIKNKINIGADANVLRAAELSNGRYTWILCDDDNYDFTVCDDVLAELIKGEAAAIMVGWSNEFVWPTGSMYDTPDNLMKQSFPYFSVPTFVPGSIFKTELFQAQIRISYTNIVNLFPAMTYYIKLYEDHNMVYVSKKRLVTAMGQAGYYYTYLKVMSATINTFYLIKSKKIRRKAFYGSYLTPPYFSIYKHALMWESTGDVIPFLAKWRYFLILNWKGRIIFLAAVLMAPIANHIKLPDLLLKKLKAYRL